MPEHLLEERKRLSESLLWQLQQQAYTQFGIKAWSYHGVPSYITSNSYTARCYAHTVLGYLRDLKSKQALDPDHPIYLFDLGAGTGRFAYLFLKELLRLIGNGDLVTLNLCYVMTDIADDNIAFWQRHPYLMPYFEQGLLDCAHFHHAQQEPIHLICRNETLTKEAVVNPIVVIGNYFFDTIPQDLFRMQNGQLEEGRITLFTSKAPSENKIDPHVINDLQYRYSYDPLPASYCYMNKSTDAVFKRYCAQCQDAVFLFPTGAIQVIDTFASLSNKRLLLLAGDQGACTLQQALGTKEPKVALHGSFSIAVNYHALAAFIESLHGKALLTSFPDPAFVVMGAVLDQEDAHAFHETQIAFQDHIDSFEPTDYWRFVSLTEREWKEPPLNQMLFLIKLGNWDAMSLHAFFPEIRKCLKTASAAQQHCLTETIHRVWDHYYPVAPQEASFIVNLGTLFLDMNLRQEAALYFQRALDLCPTNQEAKRALHQCQ